MTPAITLEELLVWADESAVFWKAHLDANPALLELPCGIGGAATVQDFVRHIWGVELRWSQRVANLPVIATPDIPSGPLEALFGLHEQAMEILRKTFADANYDWAATLTLDFDWLPPQARTCTMRKLAAHGLTHSQRHWAQLTTLARNAGSPSGFRGDLLFSAGLQ